MDLESSAAPLSTTNSSWLSPSHAHAYRLLIFKEQSNALLAFAKDCNQILITLFREENAQLELGVLLGINSLTMSYFHTGTRTIIGAEAFHCPVRDGKEWDHLAMVIRLNLLPP